MVDDPMTNFLKDAGLHLLLSLNPQVHDKRLDGNALNEDREKHDHDDGQNEQAPKFKVFTDGDGQGKSNRST